MEHVGRGHDGPGARYDRKIDSEEVRIQEFGIQESEFSYRFAATATAGLSAVASLDEEIS
jgi:hypothetical protein